MTLCWPVKATLTSESQVTHEYAATGKNAECWALIEAVMVIERHALTSRANRLVCKQAIIKASPDHTLSPERLCQQKPNCRKGD